MTTAREMAMTDDTGSKRINLSIELPDDISAIIEHEAIMRAKQPSEILSEVIQKMFDDSHGEIAAALQRK